MNFSCGCFNPFEIYNEKFVKFLLISNDRERYRGMSEEQIKQDCELKAFVRLAGKIKKSYPRLPTLLLGDSLYACEPVMKICRDYGWDYLLRFKDGRIPSIAEEYQAIPEKQKWEKQSL